LENPRACLIVGATQLKINITENQADKMFEYICQLKKWNKIYNLTAITNEKDMVVKHLLDSLSISRYINGLQVLDVGSGAGLPGIPLAITNPDVHFTLIDSSGKKVSFLKHIIIQLDLINVTVENHRIERWQPKIKFDEITVRAFSSLAKIVSMTSHLIKQDGKWLAMKGAFPQEEIKELTHMHGNINHYENIPLNVPGCTAKRCLVILKRVSTYYHEATDSLFSEL